MNKINVFDKQTLIQELETNLWGLWSNFGRGPGCALHDEGDVIWFENPIPIIPYNGVIKFQVHKNIDQRIDRLINCYHDRRVAFMWVLHPTSFPQVLPEMLENRGLQEVEIMPGMVRSLDNLPEPPPVPDGMEVRKVIGEVDLSEYYSFVSWRWEVPKEYNEQLRATLAKLELGKTNTKAHAWQVWSDGQPVAKVGLYLMSESAGIYGVATRPEMRRRGLGGILILTALKTARALGKNLAILHSTPMAEGLYRSLGFEAIADFRLYASEEVHI